MSTHAISFPGLCERLESVGVVTEAAGLVHSSLSASLMLATTQNVAPKANSASVQMEGPACAVRAKQRVPLIHTSSCLGVTSVCRQGPSSHHGVVQVARRRGCLAMPTGMVVTCQSRGCDETSAL